MISLLQVFRRVSGTAVELYAPRCGLLHTIHVNSKDR